MKRKQIKIKVVQDNKKGFPKDLSAAAIEKAIGKTGDTERTPKNQHNHTASTVGNTIAKEAKSEKAHDPHIPAINSVITRKYKGEELKIKVLENGFEYKGQAFKSISALAVHIVGGPISGYVFFKLVGQK
ncbi:MAG: DUF2924 domain-containing protein [Elusimicrobiota bacterium]|jgi:hypothetical protein|nr:DUF2924 domain-containing protein [Elusimicrobiota bacterium]